MQRPQKKRLKGLKRKIFGSVDLEAAKQKRKKRQESHRASLNSLKVMVIVHRLNLPASDLKLIASLSANSVGVIRKEISKYPTPQGKQIALDACVRFFKTARLVGEPEVGFANFFYAYVHNRLGPKRGPK